ncbi:MAG: MFS transporter [Rhodanobacter sp.]
MRLPLFAPSRLSVPSFLRPILPLLVSTLFLFASIGLLNTLLQLYGSDLGFSDAFLGALTAAYYAGFLLGTFLVPPLIRHIGHIRAFALAAVLVACVTLAYIVSASPTLWFLLRVLNGILMVSLYTVVESWINSTAQPSERSGAFAIYMVVNLVAEAASQQFLRIDMQATTLLVVVTMLMCAAAVPVLLTQQPQPAQQAAPRLQLRRLFHAAPTAGVGALLSGLAMGAFYGLAPVYALKLGFARADISNYMMVGILGGAALQWPLGKWSDHVDRRLAIMVTSLLAAGFAALLLVTGAHALVASLCIFAYCGLAFAIYPMVVAHLVDYLRAEELVGASSSIYLIFGGGSALGPAVVGVWMARMGPAALPLWFAFAHGALAIYAFWRLRTRPREKVADNNFRVMAQTATTALAESVQSTKGQAAHADVADAGG